MSKQTISYSDRSVNSTYVLISERPSFFVRADATLSRFMIELDKILIAYEHEIAESLAGAEFSRGYRLAEIDGYLHRLGSVLRAHERQTSERAAQAELAERGSAWVNKRSAEPKEQPNDI